MADPRLLCAVAVALLVQGCAAGRTARGVPTPGQCISIEVLEWTWVSDGGTKPVLEPSPHPVLGHGYLLTDSLGPNQGIAPGYVLQPLGPLGIEPPRWSAVGDSLFLGWGGGFHGFGGTLAQSHEDAVAWSGMLDPHSDVSVAGEWRPTVEARLTPCVAGSTLAARPVQVPWPAAQPHSNG